MIQHYLVINTFFRELRIMLYLLLFFSFFYEKGIFKTDFKDIIRKLSSARRLENFKLRLIRLSILELLVALPKNLPMIHKLFYIFKVFKDDNIKQEILHIMKKKIMNLNSLNDSKINLRKITIEMTGSQDALKTFYLYELKKHNLDFSSWILLLYGSRLIFAFFIPMLLLFTNTLHNIRMLSVILLGLISFIAFIDSKDILVFYLGKNKKFLNKRYTSIFTKIYTEIDLKETKFTYNFFKDIIFYLRDNHSLILAYLKALMRQNLPNVKEKNNNSIFSLYKKLKKGILNNIITYMSFFNIILNALMLPDNKKFFRLSAILANWRKDLFLDFIQLIAEVLLKKISYLEERLIIINSYSFKMSVLGYMISIVDGLLLALSPVYSIVWNQNVSTIYSIHLSLFSLGLEFILYNTALGMIMINTFLRLSSIKKAITIAVISLTLFNTTFIIFSIYILNVLSLVQ